MVGVVVRVDEVGHLVGHTVGGSDLVDGALQVDLGRPGLGLELKRNDVSKYRIL